MACWHIYRPADRAEESEIRVAEKLKRLDDKWLVVWGYLYQSKSGMECEGDFLILGPAGGALVLEVKSSLPRIFTATGYGESDERGDPFSQLMKQWNGVVRAMKGYEESPFVAKAICVPSARMSGAMTSDVVERSAAGSNEFAGEKVGGAGRINVVIQLRKHLATKPRLVSHKYTRERNKLAIKRAFCFSAS